MLFELLEARKRQIAQQYHYARRIATKSNEPFKVSHAEWMNIWRRQPDPTEPGRIIKRDSSQPWSLRNCVFVQCDDVRTPQISYRGVRTLTVQEWVHELRGER